MKKIFWSILAVIASMTVLLAVENNELPASSVKVSVDELAVSDTVGSRNNYDYSSPAVPAANISGRKKAAPPVPPLSMVEELPATDTAIVADSAAPAAPVVKNVARKYHGKAKAEKGQCPKSAGANSICWAIFVIGVLAVLLIGGTAYLVWDGVKKINANTEHFVYQRDITVQEAIETKTALTNEQACTNQLRAELAEAGKREQTLQQQNREQAKLAENRLAAALRAADIAANEAQNTIRQLESKCAGLNDQVADLTGKLQNSENALTEKKQTVDALNVELSALISLIGKNICEIMDGLPEDRELQAVMLGLAKLQAIKDAGAAELEILKDFQAFDSQMSVIIKDVETIQKLRENSKFLDFLKECMPHFEIVWPAIGKNISEYRKEMLDLSESARGTTIAQVKRAAIFPRDDENPFQKAIVVCK